MLLFVGWQTFLCHAFVQTFERAKISTEELSIHNILKRDVSSNNCNGTFSFDYQQKIDSLNSVVS